ncbi:MULTISPECIES: hypothetical protein [Bacteria]|nr:hypothetical protein [Stenotrophomonas maltophilia]MBH1477351.1 hypothetical protein [Stenotrophomonas maltophilia]MBH1503350.1 hypothetical protein [Stenotrophomonas maltophilia]MBH1784024.1 hypothetical protein [Stenotrophomonas maltophilia]
MDTERIETRGEDGRVVSVIKHRTRIDTSDLSGRSWVEGLARYTLADGSAVNADGNDFEVVATGERLVRT